MTVMEWLKALLTGSIALVTIVITRICFLILFPSQTRTARDPASKCKVAVFLGSGGHTTEMLQLLSALPVQRYSPRVYVVASGDQFSQTKAAEAEGRRGEEVDREAEKGGKDDFQFVTLPRARNVHQAWLSTPLTVLIAFIACIKHIVLPSFSRSAQSGKQQHSSPFADLILMNGPGTCVPIVASVWILRFFGLPSPRMVYVESFARVRSLSLTAKILRYFVDRFVVQWNECNVRGSFYRGWLV
ncbi:glycosyltransferase family 1 protein [Meira miltonrushii]|uniref:UDP-N-acetylglucosamine transferase subunit ALG14 n=1 Tax=Meira miltonrushii TaxID=1280837 RepID=A0A316VI03_9BASI|nr:glycosyltransferase family 1 protein [Meira miltonrushii]PWN35145.1 glycosyltransferase family 1 protein [Meira miltonrushii]